MATQSKNLNRVLFSFFVLFISFTGLVFAQDKAVSPKKEISAREMLEMDLDSAFQIIGKLNKEQTVTLINQIRTEAKKDYKDIDKFYLLISHLETMRAIEEEEKKLRDLNLVYILGLVLVVGVIGYTLFAQRKTIESIQQYIKE